MEPHCPSETTKETSGLDTDATGSLTIPQPRRRKKGIILTSSPVVAESCLMGTGTKKQNPIEQKTKGRSTAALKAQPEASKSRRRVRIVSAVKTKLDPVGEKNKDEHARSGEDDCAKSKTDSETSSGSGAKSRFDAKAEKSVRYMKSGGTTMKTSTMFEESKKNAGDILETRSKLRQLQISYSKANVNLNDRVIMCDILRVTHNVVIPRIKLMHAMERRLQNHRQHSRRRVAVFGRKTQELAKTVSEMKKEREERIKQKQQKAPQRTVETLRATTAEEVSQMRNYRYLRVNLGDEES